MAREAEVVGLVTGEIRAGGFRPMAAVVARCYAAVVNPFILLVLLMLLFGGGGYYIGGPTGGGGAVGVVLIICLIIFFMGGWRSKS